MRPSLWAEIHRLRDFGKFSQREIAVQLHCGRDTVGKALAMTQPPGVISESKRRRSKLDSYKPAIKELLDTYPHISALRIREEISKLGYTGGHTILGDYLQGIRERCKRVYQPVEWKMGDAMQVDWGDCGTVQVVATRRKVSVFVAVLCYSRVLYIEFTLDQKKDTFYRGIVNALTFFGGSPQRIIVDNLKAAVLAGHGRTARFHPEVLDLCGYYRMQPVACSRRDPESKGIVESGVRYVKHNALAGRKLESYADYKCLAEAWLQEVNARIHRNTGERPIDRLAREKLSPLPELPYDTRKVCQCVVNSHASVTFETNRYSVPPEIARLPVTLKADENTVWIYFQDREVALHKRSYERKTSIINKTHRQAALARHKQDSDRHIEAIFGDLGQGTVAFIKGLRQSNHQPIVQMRKILNLRKLYGRNEVLKALEVASNYHAFDAAYVENLIQQNRRRLALPSPLPLTPIRMELLDTIDLEEPDLDFYDNLIQGEDREEDKE